ncbi:MAG: tetratricopeptide repeat protein [Spirochaetales bacterium]|nr:tetratricopeptide repeat protein [Spirochaetales bacterium]
MKRLTGLVFLALMAAAVVGQDFAVEVTPSAFLPLGESSEYFDFGGGAVIDGVYAPEAIPVYAGVGVGYHFLPTPAPEGLSLITGGVGGGLNLKLGSLFELRAGIGAGGYVGVFGGAVGFNPYAAALGSVRLNLSPSFSLGIGGGYYYLLNSIDAGLESFLTGTSISVGAVIRPGAGGSGPAREPKIRIEPPQFDRIFPVFYQYYNSNSLGSVVIANEEAGEIQDVKVALFVNRFMDTPKISDTVASIERDGQAEIPLYGLFTTEILDVIEPTTVAAEIQVSYRYRDQAYTTSVPYTMQVLNRNNMSWDDDRRAAAFVSPNDPTVRRFVGNITSATRSASANTLNETLGQAMALFESLRLYGVSYQVDPNSSYIELSENENAIDYLNFPSQTLDYKSGDCDDLSILFASLLESLNIRTAFVTIPQHIYMAFHIAADREQIEGTFSSTADLIYRDDGVWLPLEITLLEEGFLEAWSIGAKEWRENESRGTAGFWPMDEAWGRFSPASFEPSAIAIAIPPSSDLSEAFGSELSRTVAREIQPLVAELEDRIVRSAFNPRIINRLGTLYGRYGLFAQAEEQFIRALREDSDYAPALINLGNIFFLRDDLEEALDYFERAFGIRPDDPEVLLSLARTHYERSEYNPARTRYEEAELISPELAANYIYIVGGGSDTARASAAQKRNDVLWESE